MTGRLTRLMDGVNGLAAGLCHLLLVVIVLITLMQVGLRFLLNQPTSWSEEIAMLCLVWFGLLAIAVAVWRHEHIAIMVLRDALPAPYAKALDYLAQLLVGVFMATLILTGGDLIALAGQQLLPASRLPKWLLYWPTIVGGGLGLLNVAANLLLGRLDDPGHHSESLTDDLPATPSGIGR